MLDFPMHNTTFHFRKVIRRLKLIVSLFVNRSLVSLMTIVFEKKKTLITEANNLLRNNLNCNILSLLCMLQKSSCDSPALK